jgi:nucleoside-diphosphate-sugar epimerase
MMTSASTESMDWKGCRCLVTGSAGFIGRALCARLRALGAEVHESRHRPPPSPVGDQQTCDVSVASEVEALFAQARPGWVFHLAGVVNSGRSLDLVRPTMTTNLLGTVNVLMCAAAAQCSNVVVLGSLQEPDEVHPAVPSPRTLPRSLALPLMRECCKGVWRAGRDCQAIHGLRSRSGRLWKTRAVCRAAVDHWQRGRVDQWPKGVRLVYVDDAVEAIIAVASRPDLAGQTIDIGSAN